MSATFKTERTIYDMTDPNFLSIKEAQIKQKHEELTRSFVDREGVNFDEAKNRAWAELISEAVDSF